MLNGDEIPRVAYGDDAGQRAGRQGQLERCAIPEGWEYALGIVPRDAMADAASQVAVRGMTGERQRPEAAS